MGKGALTVLSVLALLSCLLLAGASGAIGPTGGDVHIEETVLAGDPAAVQGLEMSAEYQCEYQMHWLTRFPVGRLEEQETEFSYTTSETGYRIFSFEDGLEIDFFEEGTTFYFSVDGMGELYSISGREPCVLPLYQEVVERARAQRSDEELQEEGYVEEIRLEDKYDYLPLTFRTWHIPFLVDEHVFVLEDYFRIPVPEELILRFSVGHGTWYSVGASLMQGTMELDAHTVILDEENREDLLFAVSLENCDLPLDDSLIPGGWGIYRLTCVKDENQNPQPPRLTTVYSVPEGERIFRFWASEDKRDLFLLTCGEDQTLHLTVLDGKTFAPRQTINLFTFPENQVVAFPNYEGDPVDYKQLHLYNLFQGEDFVVISTSYSYLHYVSRSTVLENGQVVWESYQEPLPSSPVGMDELCACLALLVREDDGSWQVRFIADTSLLERDELNYEKADIAFDGTRLAIAGNGFTPFAAVWSGPELDFLATYHHSLDDSYLPTIPYCGPAEDGSPWKVSWQS